MISSARDIYEHITQELALDFKATYCPIAGGLHQFRLSPLINVKTYDQRIAFWQIFSQYWSQIQPFF